MSAMYERGVVGYGAPHETLVIAGLVARQRRLLLGAYVLADHGHLLEASILQRSMLEFLIVQKWLTLDMNRNVLLWVADDLRSRLRINRELRELIPDEYDAAIANLDAEARLAEEGGVARMEAQIEQACAELGVERLPPRPSMRDIAVAVDMAVPYSMAYRFDSLSAAHPSALAIEQLMQNRPELGGVGLLPEPPPERGRADPYAMCAVLLRDGLLGAAELIPELRPDGLDEVVARLETLWAAIQGAP